MLVYRCDAIDCNVQGEPRFVHTWRVRRADEAKADCGYLYGDNIRETTLEMPPGWSELQTYMGLDKEEQVATDLLVLRAGATEELTIVVQEPFMATGLAVFARDGKDDIYIGDIKMGRVRVREVKEKTALSTFVWPPIVTDMVLSPWMRTSVALENRGSGEKRVQFIATGLYTMRGGVQIVRSKRYLCPDHTPKVRG